MVTSRSGCSQWLPSHATQSLARDDPWSWEIDGNRIVCDQPGWRRHEAEIEALIEQFADMASDPSITASLTVPDPDTKLDAERQDLFEESAPVYDRLGVYKQAPVSETMTSGMALESLVDTPDRMDIRTFKNRTAAMEWCQE